MTKRTPPFSPQVRERAVRMVQDHQGEHSSRHAAIRSKRDLISARRRAVVSRFKAD